MRNIAGPKMVPVEYRFSLCQLQFFWRDEWLGCYNVYITNEIEIITFLYIINNS